MEKTATNPVRYEPSGGGFARVRIGGKLIRQSLKTDVLNVAQQRLGDLVEDDLAKVGSINVDYRSFHLNFELALMVADTGFARAVAVMLETDFARCRRVDLASEYARRPWWFRAAVRVARLLSPVQ